MEKMPQSNTNKPIYQQIVDHIKTLIDSGQLSQGEALPSIRQLAEDLQVSAITTKRAYEELERENFIRTIPSKGSFVAVRDLDQVRDEYLKKIELHMREIRLLADFCDISDKELELMFHLQGIKKGQKS